MRVGGSHAAAHVGFEGGVGEFDDEASGRWDGDVVEGDVFDDKVLAWDRESFGVGGEDEGGVGGWRHGWAVVGRRCAWW